MDIFKIATKIVPETSEQRNYYNNYIQKWRKLYQNEEKTTSFKNADGHTRTRVLKSMKLPKMLASEMASLIFTEKVSIAIENNDTYTKYVNDVLNKNSFQSKKLELIEYMFALGGSVDKIYSKNEEVIIDYVVADSFIPTNWSNEQISGGMFLTTTQKNKYTYTLVENHTFENGVITITSKLYKSMNDSAENEGVEVPLSELYPDLLEVVVIDNVTRPIFSYSKPSIANNVDLDTPLGISIFENSIDTIEILDTCFDSWDREFKLGKKRIMVPAYAIKKHTLVDGTSINYFDADSDVFQAIDVDENDNFKFQDDTQELRVEEHVASINALLNVLCVQIGLSQGAISFDAKSGLKTATEVISENSKTFRTKKRHEVNLEKNLKEIVTAIIEVGQLYGKIKKVNDYNIIVTFDDSIIIDNEAQSTKDMQKVTMGLMSKLKYMVKHEGYTEEEARKELKEINKSSGGDII